MLSIIIIMLIIIDTGSEDILTGYRDVIRHRKICHANNEKGTREELQETDQRTIDYTKKWHMLNTESVLENNRHNIL